MTFLDRRLRWMDTMVHFSRSMRRCLMSIRSAVVRISAAHSRAVRRGLALSLLGSAAGTLLAFYMALLGKYSLMTPLTLLAFLLLWVLPVLLLTDWTGRY